MTLNFFLIQLAVLFLPGVIWEHLDARFAAKEKPTQLEFLARSLLFGLVSHLVTYGLFVFFERPYEIANFAEADKVVILTERVVLQTAVATGAGFLLSLLWLRGAKGRWLPRFLIWSRITNRYGDEDVWDYVFNAPGVGSTWVNVRDFEKQLTYMGFVSTYSQHGQLRELSLTDVTVYNFDGELFFTSPQIYISLKTEGAHIEFPLAPSPKGGSSDEPVQHA